MAFDISYIIEARDRYSKTAEKIRKQNAKLKSSFSGLSKEAGITEKNIVKMAKKAGKAVGLLLAGTFTLAFTKMISKGKEFQTNLKELSAITGATGKDLKFLETSTFQLSKQYKKSGAEILTAFKLVGSASPELLKNLPALKQVTAQVVLLSKAGRVDLKTATDAVTISLNSFGKGAESAAKFVNILAAGSKQGSSEIADTGLAIRTVAGDAQAAGLTFVQTNALIQTLSKTFKGSEAGTALRGIIKKIGAAGKDLSKVGLSQTFKNIGKEIDGINDIAAKNKVIQKYFGEFSAQGLLLTKSTKALARYEKSLLGTNTATEQARINANTFDEKLKGLSESVNNVLIKAFLKIEPSLSRAAVAAETFFNSFDNSTINDSVTVLKAIGSVLLFIAKVAGNVILIFGILGKSIGEFVASTVIVITSLFSIMGSVFSDLINVAQNKFGQILNAVSELVAGIAKIIQASNPFQALSSGFNSVKDFASDFFGGSSSPVALNLAGGGSTSDINVNIRDKGSNVQSVESKSSGSNIRVGKNL